MIDINIIQDCSCYFQAIDTTDYSKSIHEMNLTKYAFIEFMVYLPYQETDEEQILLPYGKKTSFFNTSLDRTYSYTFKKDGHYNYYKYVIMTPDNTAIYNNGVYQIQNRIFYYNGIIYLGTRNTTSLVFDITNSIIISNWYLLKDYIGTHIDLYNISDLFTIYKLEQCLISLQKKNLFDGLKNCSSTGNINKCEDSSIDKMNRDFLLASVFILKYLICNKSYLEAQRIIESLSTCGNLCDDTLYNGNNNNCGCGSSI